MKDHTTPLFRQLASAGVRAPTVTPGADIQSTTFNIIGLPPETEGKKNYLQNFCTRLTTVFDPDAAGSAVSFDQLPKGMSAIRLAAPVLGDPYQVAHTRGAVLAHLYQVVGAGYQTAQPARGQIPASTDTDVTIDLYFILPYSFEGFVKPHETAQFVGLFEQGELECRVAASTVYDGDYAGAVTKATTTLRAWYEYLPSPDNFIGCPFQFHEYIIPGNSTEFVLRGVGSSSGLKGIANDVAGLVMLAWLSDATGIGLSGADGVDEINRIDMPFRSQNSMDIVDPYFSALRRMTGGRVGPVAGLGTTIVHDGSGWPYTMAATPNNTLANAQALFLPLVMPGKNFETSKAQRVKGDLTVNLGFGTTPSGSSRFATLELLEYDIPQLEVITRAMGMDPASVRPQKKLSNGPADLKKARFTRTML